MTTGVSSLVPKPSHDWQLLSWLDLDSNKGISITEHKTTSDVRLIVNCTHQLGRVPKLFFLFRILLSLYLTRSRFCPLDFGDFISWPSSAVKVLCCSHHKRELALQTTVKASSCLNTRCRRFRRSFDSGAVTQKCRKIKFCHCCMM